MFRNFKVVSQVVFGRGCFNQLDDIISKKRESDASAMIFLIDDVFLNKDIKNRIKLAENDEIIWVNVDDEPKTEYIDQLTAQIKKKMKLKSVSLPEGVIGIGGGSAMDLAKAVALMLTNQGSSSEYQGWDLIKNPAVYHVGVPTLSGTGSEVSRTTVLTGPEKKLGINSDYTVFDQIILDPELIKDVPKQQWFYTGMDCYIHCIESLTGTYLNTFSQSFGEKSLDLCREVFLEYPDDADDKLMMASYFGGMSIAYSQVGVCHALSYGLSYVFGIHHGVGNCIAFNCLDEYYAEGVSEFRKMMETNKIELPSNICPDVSKKQLKIMTDVSLVLEPLWENALGKNWKKIITREKIESLYKKMLR